jgi:hypothetical protein
VLSYLPKCCCNSACPAPLLFILLDAMLYKHAPDFVFLFYYKIAVNRIVFSFLVLLIRGKEKS